MARSGRSRGILEGGLGAILLALFLWPLPAQSQVRTSGAKVLVKTAEPSEEIKGELIGVREGAVVVEDQHEGARVIPVERILSVRILRKTAAFTMGLAGAFAGGLAGLAAASYRDSSEDGPYEGALASAYYIGAGLAGGLVLGVTSGIFLGADKSYDLEDMTPEGKLACLAKLRKHARIRKYR